MRVNLLEAHVIQDARYLEYFSLFNQSEYYEAHEVLEQIWHEVRPDGHLSAFCKGLIQLAGAFCHLKLHYHAPDHPAHGRRLAPASRLFKLASTNLDLYKPVCCQLDLTIVQNMTIRWAERLEQEGFRKNPWSPTLASKDPQLALTLS